jgi:hypothetical protein
MPQGAYDIKALAKAIRRRREEYNRAHPHHPALITPAMSRILENDDDYVPYRVRATAKRRRAAENPRIATLIDIAHALGTTVGDLLGEQPYGVTLADRRRLREFVRYLTTLFALDAPDLDDRASSRGSR